MDQRKQRKQRRNAAHDIMENGEQTEVLLVVGALCHLTRLKISCREPDAVSTDRKAWTTSLLAVSCIAWLDAFTTIVSDGDEDSDHNSGPYEPN
jgi:hypothetical protein